MMIIAFLFRFSRSRSLLFMSRRRRETRSDVIGLMDSREKKLFVLLLLLARTKYALGRTLSKNKTDLLNIYLLNLLQHKTITGRVTFVPLGDYERGVLGDVRARFNRRFETGPSGVRA